MRRLITEEKYFLVEGVITSAWIKGIKSGWEKLATETKNHSERVDAVPDMDPKHIDKAASVTRELLGNIRHYVQVLRSDLLIDKGFWSLPPSEGLKSITPMQKAADKINKELDSAEEAAADGVSRIEWDRESLKEKDRFGGASWDYKDSRTSQDRFNWHIRAFWARVDECVDLVDAFMQRLFQHLDRLPKKSPLAKELPPDVVHVGNVTIIFHDIPPHRRGGEIPSPKEVGKMHPRTQDVTLSPYGNYYGYIDPRKREDVIDVVRNSREALRSKGLDKLMVGEIHVYPQSKAGTNVHGAEWGVGAEYFRQGDVINVYGETYSSAIVHEVGHRYWFKFMSREDQENFSRWFRDVPSVTKYGSVSSWEDFAEVFMFYVLNKKLTKDQKERFMQFMKGKRHRLESFINRLKREVALLEVSVSLPSGFLEGSKFKDEVFVGVPYGRRVNIGHSFKPEGGKEYGIYVTPNRRYARLYGSTLVRGFVNFKHPIIVENKGEISSMDLMKDDVQYLESEGYDAIVSTSSTIDKATEFVLFHSQQLFVTRID
jgi:hypothetical protein